MQYIFKSKIRRPNQRPLQSAEYLNDNLSDFVHSLCRANASQCYGKDVAVEKEQVSRKTGHSTFGFVVWTRARQTTSLQTCSLKATNSREQPFCPFHGPPSLKRR